MRELVAVPKPANRECICGGVIEAFNFFGGPWRFYDKCEPCMVEDSEAEERQQARLEERMRRNRIRQAVHGSGMSPRELAMSAESWTAPAAVRQAVDGWVAGKHGLYLHGTVGSGKTYAAVVALRRYIETTGNEGLFRVTAELINDLREAVMRGQDTRMVDTLISAPALVLDDMAVERSTPYALEAMYLLIDGWYRSARPHLIITSNIGPDDLASKLDDRIASRIMGHCKVLEFRGADKRLKARS